MKSITTLFVLFCTMALQGQKEYLGQLPNNPELGKCYVKHIIPDEFEIKTFRVIEVPAHKILEVVPAEYKMVHDDIVVKPASKNYKFTPATYSTVIDTIWIEEPFNKITTIDAVYKDGYKELEYENKSGEWLVEKDPNCESKNPNDCRLYHFRETPSLVDKVPVKKLFAPARTNTKRVGGKYKLIKRKVLVTPAITEEVIVPQEKEVVERRVLVKDETTKEIDVPAKYKTVERRLITKKGGIIWKEVPCISKSNSSTTVILSINFELGSAKLTDQSKSIIDMHILPKLLESKSTVVQIGSHTDSRGSSSINYDLSEKRSVSVLNYLKQRGIDGSRMIAVGYGESRLLNDCKDGVDCVESKHAENRRTEFKFF